ncbi:MAG TPA: hypothetical protein VFN56_03005 [Candidatus Saccharimonadales bacterium]|nr:hypothetical protein [Candidatus Saccharimonadales bacterium]
MNQELSKLIDQFLKDEHYWQSQMAHAATKIKLRTDLQSPNRTRH